MRSQLLRLSHVVVVVGTVMIIVIIVLASNVILAAGLFRDVVTAIGGHVATMGGLNWYQCSTGKRENVRAKCCDPVTSYVTPPLF